MIDVAIPGESHISQKTVEKLTKYVDQKIKVSRLWKTNGGPNYYWYTRLCFYRFAQLYCVTQFAILLDCNLSKNCTVQNIVNFKAVLANLNCSFLYPMLLDRARIFFTSITVHFLHACFTVI